MKNQTESTPPPAPSTPTTPETTKPTESKLPYHIIQFTDLIQTLQDSLDAAPPPAPGAPEYAQYVDNQTFLQQCLLVDHLKLVLQTDGLDHRAISNLRQTLALIEKTRARHERKSTKDAARQQREQQREQVVQPERDEARNFLQTELAQGERPAKDLLQLARSIGIAPATLKRAKTAMNVISTQRHHPDRCWMWSIPTPAPSSAPDSQDTPVAALVPAASAAGPDATTTQAQQSTPTSSATLSASSPLTQHPALIAQHSRS